MKKKILASGHSQKDIEDALTQLNTQGQGNAPGVNATINKINQTNIPLEQKAPQQKPKNQPMVGQSPKKSKKWLWITLSLILVLLILGGGAIWWFWDKILTLF